MTLNDLSPLLALADGRYTVYLYKPNGTSPFEDGSGVGYTACVKVGDYEGGSGVCCLVIHTTNETVFLRIQQVCEAQWGDGEEDDSQNDGNLDRFFWQG